jgi:hypothetical protein
LVRITGPIDPRFLAVQRLGSMMLTRASTAPVEAPPPPAPPMTLAQPHTSVAMLLAIAASDPQGRRQRQIADATRGLGALERLDAIRRTGRPDAGQLRELAAWIDSHTVPDDGDAAALLREVELRVLVELAKGERE